MEQHKTMDDTLENMQNNLRTELNEYVTVENPEDYSLDDYAIGSDTIAFHNGIPVTFTPKQNAMGTGQGIIIASFVIKEGTENKTGSISCTEHGDSMSFRFSICP